jgi:hypothetical protein
MPHTHDPANGATPHPSRLADADSRSGWASRRDTARPATRESRDPAPRRAPDREPLDAVEAYYAQETLQHTPSFY